jgi:hypothetical protein
MLDDHLTTPLKLDRAEVHETFPTPTVPTTQDQQGQDDKPPLDDQEAVARQYALDRVIVGCMAHTPRGYLSEPGVRLDPHEINFPPDATPGSPQESRPSTSACPARASAAAGSPRRNSRRSKRSRAIATTTAAAVVTPGRTARRVRTIAAM